MESCVDDVEENGDMFVLTSLGLKRIEEIKEWLFAVELWLSYVFIFLHWYLNFKSNYNISDIEVISESIIKYFYFQFFLLPHHLQGTLPSYHICLNILFLILFEFLLFLRTAFLFNPLVKLVEQKECWEDYGESYNDEVGVGWS